MSPETESAIQLLAENSTVVGQSIVTLCTILMLAALVGIFAGVKYLFSSPPSSIKVRLEYEDSRNLKTVADGVKSLSDGRKEELRSLRNRS